MKDLNCSCGFLYRILVDLAQSQLYFHRIFNRHNSLFVCVFYVYNRQILNGEYVFKCNQNLHICAISIRDSLVFFLLCVDLCLYVCEKYSEKTNSKHFYQVCTANQRNLNIPLWMRTNSQLKYAIGSWHNPFIGSVVVNVVLVWLLFFPIRFFFLFLILFLFKCMSFLRQSVMAHMACL